MKHIINLNAALKTGLGLFLITGLAGCEDKPDECKKLTFATQETIDKCQKLEAEQKTSSASGSSTGSTHSSGFFAPMLFNSSSGHSSGHSSSSESLGG